MTEEFYVDKQIAIAHTGGWRHVVYAYDDHMIGVRYEDDSGGHPMKLDGLWLESARKLAKALEEMADNLEDNAAQPDGELSREARLERALCFAAGAVFDAKYHGLIGDSVVSTLRRLMQDAKVPVADY